MAEYKHTHEVKNQQVSVYIPYTGDTLSSLSIRSPRAFKVGDNLIAGSDIRAQLSEDMKSIFDEAVVSGIAALKLYVCLPWECPSEWAS